MRLAPAGRPILSSYGKHNRLQKVVILYRLIWVRDDTLLAAADLVSFLPGSRLAMPVLVKVTDIEEVGTPAKQRGQLVRT